MSDSTELAAPTFPGPLNLSRIEKTYGEFGARRFEMSLDADELQLQAANLHLFAGILSREVIRLEREDQPGAAVREAETALADLSENLTWIMRRSRFVLPPGEMEERIDASHRAISHVIELLRVARLETNR